MDEEALTINRVCEILGASKHTVRRLLRNGLVHGIRRQAKNHYRVLDSEQLDLLKTLHYLNQGGVSMRDLKKYSHLEYGGVKTIAERKAFLETKKRQIWQELEDLQEAIDHIERKIETIEQKQ